MAKEQDRIQTYNDGVAVVLKCTDLADPGDAPNLAYAESEKLCYESRTVGVSRYYQAMQNNLRADLLLRFPRRDHVTAQDRIRIGATDYTIRQIQYPMEARPLSMDLTLEAVTP